MAAIALLFHNALITNYIWGLDIQSEYTAAQLVISNGFWGAPPLLTQASMDVNSVMSVTVFAPLLSIATGMSLTWVFKLIFPLLFALVPLGLYRLWQKQTSHRIALFGVFYFIVTFSFYTEMVAMARQELAELFLVMLLLLIVDRRMDKAPRVALFALFGLSLIVSHYALTYVFLFCFVLAMLVVAFTKRYDLGALIERLKNRGKEQIARPCRRSGQFPRSVSINALLAVGLVIAALLWYRFANNPEPFNNLDHHTEYLADHYRKNAHNPADRSATEPGAKWFEQRIGLGCNFAPASNCSRRAVRAPAAPRESATGARVDAVPHLDRGDHLCPRHCVCVQQATTAQAHK